MRHLVSMLVVTFALLQPSFGRADCSSFSGSTSKAPGVAPARWRTDYPSTSSAGNAPWKAVDFRSDPGRYMSEVLGTIRPHLKRSGTRLIGTGSEPWWISRWLDYGTSGREPAMGLTKERGPDPKDLSPTNADGWQVWAVGFYNEAGSTVFKSVFNNPCDVALPPVVNFPEDAASIKFLFTDIDPNELTYLQGAPTYKAFIDALGSGSESKDVEDRTEREVRLLQVDVAVKDSRATATGWVFGTFAWVGPASGDELFDNLVPVTLQWGNDPGEYGSGLSETWINPSAAAMYGWPERPSLGFQGRANGPADNVRSSCLSCHAAARTPRSPKNLLGSRFKIPQDLADPAKVKDHVDTWFANIPSGQLFDPGAPAVSALDYSLQLEAAAFRICRACRAGDLTGSTPTICIAANFYTQPNCLAPAAAAAMSAQSRSLLREEAPSRQ